ncbi:Sodium channel protein Nach [Gryllus bimaculatus]|nr:Sodium channel protein Nach [Gryllus bimaculatus]
MRHQPNHLPQELSVPFRLRASAAAMQLRSSRRRSNSCWRCLAASARGLRGAGRLLLDYCDFSSFHGLRFIADERRHWTERLFWLACCLLSWYGSILLIRASWDAFQNNAISFNTETNYLSWDTKFFSVTVCDEEPSKYIELVMKNESGSRRLLLENLAFFKYKIVGIRANKCFDPKGTFIPSSQCPTDGFKELLTKFRRPCEQMFGECRWNDVPFPCCHQFLFLENEYSTCYSFNNIHTAEPKVALDLISNRKKGPGTLFFEVNVKSKFYVMPRHEVPTLNTNEVFLLVPPQQIKQRVLYNIKEVENDPEVAQITLHQRRCRLEEEGLGVYRKYSHSACMVQCRIEAQRRLSQRSITEMTFDRLPTIRFRRNVVRTKLDLVGERLR